MEHLLIDTTFTVAAAIKMYFFFGMSVNKKDQQMRIEEKVNEYFGNEMTGHIRIRDFLNVVIYAKNEK